MQTFRYRGTRRVSLPGQLVILHPDETHDGAAGTDDGFGYRALYIAPELVHDALDGSGLPFVADPVQMPTETTRPVAYLLARLDDPVSDLARVDMAATVADALRKLSGRPDQRPAAIDIGAVKLARDYLAAHAREQTPASTLELITGSLRRLALARTAIESGLPLAEAAAKSGFADQSHMTRQFKRAYGLTPGRWAALQR